MPPTWPTQKLAAGLVPVPSSRLLVTPTWPPFTLALPTWPPFLLALPTWPVELLAAGLAPSPSARLGFSRSRLGRVLLSAGGLALLVIPTWRNELTSAPMVLPVVVLLC